MAPAAAAAAVAVADKHLVSVEAHDKIYGLSDFPSNAQKPSLSLSHPSHA